MEFTVHHDKDKHCFYADISGEVSTLDYKKIDDKTLDYYRTYVPEKLRHQGIAGKITAFALDYAKSHKYDVIPSCPYIKKYIDDHPKYANVIKE